MDFNKRFIEIWSIPDNIIESRLDEPVLKFVTEKAANPEEFMSKVKHLYRLRDEISRDEVDLKDGRTFDRYSAPMLGTDGKYYGRVWYFRDITEQKRTEEAINQERRMLRAIVDHIPDTIYVKDAECRKVMANIADVNYIGFKKENEVLGKTDVELFPGQIGLRGYTDDKEVISSGNTIFEREEGFIDRNGEKFWLITSKIPLYDKDGKITGLVGVGHDITARKKVEEALKYSLDFSESLLKTIPFGMDIVDEEGNVIFQSDNFKRQFGGEASGKNVGICIGMIRGNARIVR